jgi:hypothetical protein
MPFAVDGSFRRWFFGRRLFFDDSHIFFNDSRGFFSIIINFR